MDIQGDFVPNFDPKRSPQRPERFDYDYEEHLEDDCLECGLQLGVHTEDEILQCALKQKRGETPKG